MDMLVSFLIEGARVKSMPRILFIISGPSSEFQNEVMRPQIMCRRVSNEL